MLTDIRLAGLADKKAVIEFFKRHISAESGSVANHEFLCPFGISGAINRGQMVIMIYGNEIMGGFRFYPRKRENIASLYQFAIDKRFRSKGLLRKMLKFTGCSIFESICLADSSFNDYYRKEGWQNFKTDSKFNYWRLNITG